MHQLDLRPIVADLLAAHGLAVEPDQTVQGRSGTTYPAPLLAYDDSKLVVEFKDSPDPVEDRDVEYLADLVDDGAADHALLIHQGSAPYGLIAHDEVTLWGPGRLRSVLGDHALHQRTGVPLSPLPIGRTAPRPVDDAPERPFQPAPPPPPFPADLEAGVRLPPFDDDGLAQVLPSAFDIGPEDEDEAEGDDDAMIAIDFDALESLDAPAPIWRHATPTVPDAGIGPAILTPRVAVHEARAMVKDRISHVDQEELVLRPIHLFDYECDLMIDGTLRQETVGGRIAVYADKKGTVAVDGAVFDATAIAAFRWDGRMDDHPFRRDADRAAIDAKALIMESHTRMVDVQADDDGSDFTMTERKKVAPDGEQIRMQHLAATYHPMWRFDSDNGHVIIDALTGDTVEEALRSRSSDTIIVD